MTTFPPALVDDIQKLEADGIVELFKLQLYGGQFLYFKNDKAGVWNGNEYEGITVSLSGEGSYADQQVARPKFAVQNPDAVFSTFINQGELESAFLTRYRVKLSDYETNTPVYVSQIWQVGRVTGLTRTHFSLELRSLGDNPNFTIPARSYTPPDFPSVSINT